MTDYKEKWESLWDLYGDMRADADRRLALLKRYRWISVEEKLPDKSDYYLVCWDWDGEVVAGEVWFDESGWIHPHYGGDEKENPMEPPEIVYWMAMPLQPADDCELAKELGDE